jgi:hypothetical protein
VIRHRLSSIQFGGEPRHGEEAGFPSGKSLLWLLPLNSESAVASGTQPSKPHPFWRRRIVDPVVAQLTQGLTPHKIALTVAIGSSIALFPILGTTTIICLLVGIVMKLNQPIIQAVNYACTPIHFPFIFFSFRWGNRWFGNPDTHLDAHADDHADPNSNAHRHRHAYPLAHSNAITHAHRDAYPHTHAHSQTNGHTPLYDHQCILRGPGEI